MSQEPLPKWVTFSTAGLGGIGGWIVVHPFNTLAVRMNLAQSAGGRQLSFPQFVREAVRKNGFGSLYNGLSAGITRQIFYATSRFGLFEVFRDKLAQYRETDVWSRLLAAVTAGGSAALISAPVELCLVRMSNDATLPAAQRRNYSGVINAAARITKEEGVAAFWRGSTPFITRAMLVGATQVATFDSCKDIYRNLGITGSLSNVTASAFTAGLIYSVITMPFESAKNRMCFQKPDPATGKLLYTGTIQTISSVAKAEGALSLWGGFLPYFGRCGGHTVAMFVFVEALRKQYWLAQGAK
ncbi:hypothetical protein SARC_01675 [Sphaeroforma arctica JP610]|uniref:Mitochondrial 2-oxoglutarate/malate carrier protein n=1 Tax=Sphaeroforma arctica JP610 TaxID=667725 RepID=A0A0L0GD80_9EUKA|nr:hypothetical protein SARC_01675 [Sphaeroforma arctica JP610]KNC86198.1 hypothetical protein SARC_01675 [Sphaeroforma arctica JP610]|eukprot:XP_014160100.1 hypothetical protein SARC_01675 [Sphaeroforma arctica JP610]